MSVDKPFGMPNLPENWQWDYFESLCSKVSVGHVGETSSFFTTKNEGIPLIRSQNVRPGRLVLDDVKYVTDQFHQKSKKSQLISGDILIVRVGQNRGDCCVLPDNVGEINCANIVFGRLKDTNYSKFLGYFFNSEVGRSSLLAVSSGSAQGVLNTKSIAKVIVPVPPSNIAQNLGNKLALIDEKIQLNRQTNQTLEHIAQALFKSWFVDFEPTRAKIAAKQAGQDPERAAMAAISGKTVAELDQLDAAQLAQLKTTAALFPDGLVESELGEVPYGWEVGALQDCCIRVESGGTPKRSESTYWGGEIRWLSSGEVREVIILNTKERITDVGLQKSSAKLWPKGTTVVAMYGATAGQICLLAENVAANQACCALIPKADNRSFLFLAASRSIEGLAGKASGSAQQNLNKSLVSEHKLLLPSHSLLEKFESNTSLLIDKWISNCQESISLSETRDTLLPKLLSGELSPTTTETA